MVDHRQVHQQLKLWQSIFPEIKAVLNHAEEKQIKDEGVKNWLGDLQDLVYDADDILGEFTYQELRLKLQKTQAQANSSKLRYVVRPDLTNPFPPALNGQDMCCFIHFSRHKFEESASPSPPAGTPSLCAKIKPRSQARTSATKESTALLTR
ncbi:hypothetical protein V6Z12_D05G420300 [Gossypium hirsutum]